VSKKPKDLGDWAIRHIGRLRKNADQVKSISPDITYGPKGEWIVTKLLILGYWVDIYTAIIGNQIRRGTFDAMYYVDLLAGSGLCSVQREGRVKKETIVRRCSDVLSHPIHEILPCRKDPAYGKCVERKNESVGNECPDSRPRL